MTTMENCFFHIFIPMILSNIMHMVLVKRNAFSSLAVPVAAELFGKNKTWRAFAIVPPLNALFFWMVNTANPLFGWMEALFYGFILGLTYLLFELPNSWLKRRMGIKAGEKAKKNAWLFMLLDKMDSATGVSLLSKILFNLSWPETLKLFIAAVLIHVFFSWLLALIRLKKRF